MSNDTSKAMIQQDVLTVDQFAAAMPKQLRKRVTPEMVDKINLLMQDISLCQNFRDNLLSFTSVMQDGRYKMQSYIDAVRYVSHKMLGSGNLEAYAKTFPDRFQRLVDEKVSDKDMHSYAGAYARNKLVLQVFEQSMMPVHIINADTYQKAINVQAVLMTTANSEKVRSDAADSLMRQLKPPETAKVELDITHKTDSVLGALRDVTAKLVAEQRKGIEEGRHTPKDIAHSEIIVDGESETLDE